MSSKFFLRPFTSASRYHRTRQKISRTRKQSVSTRRKWKIKKEMEKERERQNRVDVQTELDTIRKSILRRWYAVKIILVSAATRRLQGAGGDQKDGREVRGERERETEREREGGSDGTGFSDTKTVRFGISQNLWYACIWCEQTRTVFSVFHNCPPPCPLSPPRSYRVVSLELVMRQPVLCGSGFISESIRLVYL